MNRLVKRSNFFFCVFKNDMKTLINKNVDYEFIKTINKKKKEKSFKNIFFAVGLTNLAIFFYTFQNFYSKKNKDYFHFNDITVVDHFILSEFISSIGINNFHVYLKNNFYKKLTTQLQNESYSFKENSLLGLLENLCKNKNTFIEIEKKKKEFDLLTYIFEKLKNEYLEYTKKKIYSCILFYYIKYSDELFFTYDQIQQLVYNKNLFYNLKNKEEIISYLLLLIFKNEKNIYEIYEKENELIKIYTQNNNQLNKVTENYNNSIIKFLISSKNNNKINEQSILKFYYSIKKNNENYYKQESLRKFQNYLNKINAPLLINENDLVKEKNSNNIMNKIYLKYFENTILYTFFFSFILHNINAKEYNLKTYITAFKDIYKSIYTNCIINSLFLIEKSVINNLDIHKDTNLFLLISFLFNILNSLSFSFSIYKCKYALVPLLFSQIIKDDFFL
ncbi:conserved Plasmodium protein, unknown function [Plasmodium gallinaceum]|uniref:Uncharacterized protein n=1 Tax=Plasmodium gallinaceum TaxID=5849 RepID=A0A1J1GUX7_PLAGA|nr:conserved Plasmodium protein, unknown function [Plasmodium gallinaceum]CRG95104.1 conserved Plasmodium protein, unknown function [Plasmodium gallinaceum]